jgi:outer membrane protein TolC
MIPYALAAAMLLAQAPAPAPVAPPGAAPQPAPQGLQVLRTLTLDEALREGQARNLDLRVLRERLEQSRELHWKAWSSYLPHVVASGGLTHFDVPDVTFSTPTGYAIRTVGAPAVDPNPGLPGTPSADALVPTGMENVLVQKQNTLAANILATQALFAPQAWFGILAANASEREAANILEQNRRDILFGVAQTYYGAATLKQVFTINQRQLAIALDHERDAKVRYDAGTVPKVTLLRAQIDRATAEQDLKRALNAYEASKLSIATLLGRDRAEFEVEIPAAPQLPPDHRSLMQDAMNLRPDVLASREQVTVTERNRDGTVTRYLPVVGAFARYDYSNVTGFTGKSTFWTLGLQASWTIFDGFLRESDLRENQARVREAQAARESIALKARDEVNQALIDLDSAVANRDKAKEQLALSEENQRLVTVNFKAGAATYIEVSDANLGLRQAELTLVSETLRADLSALRLLRAAGQFNPQ